MAWRGFGKRLVVRRHVAAQVNTLHQHEQEDQSRHAKDLEARPGGGREAVSDIEVQEAEHAEEATATNADEKLEGVSAAELAAWTATVRMMTNLDEFLTRE